MPHTVDREGVVQRGTEPAVGAAAIADEQELARAGERDVGQPAALLELAAGRGGGRQPRRSARDPRMHAGPFAWSADDLESPPAPLDPLAHLT